MTEGRRRLLRVLQVTSGREVAARCHVQPASVSEWTSGRKRPGEESRRWLRFNYGIPPDSWDTPTPLTEFPLG